MKESNRKNIMIWVVIFIIGLLIGLFWRTIFLN